MPKQQQQLNYNLIMRPRTEVRVVSDMQLRNTLSSAFCTCERIEEDIITLKQYIHGGRHIFLDIYSDNWLWAAQDSPPQELAQLGIFHDYDDLLICERRWLSND